jgi:hypothetical protein
VDVLYLSFLFHSDSSPSGLILDAGGRLQHDLQFDLTCRSAFSSHCRSVEAVSAKYSTLILIKLNKDELLAIARMLQCP